MLTALTPRTALLVILAVAAATIGGAWLFELAGYLPCELCLQQRWAYYAAIPLAALLMASPSAILRPGLWLLAALWLGSMAFGIYHAGVEWKWWAGPATCGATGGMTGVLPDLTKPVILCDEAALRILGLSLAGWNAVISLGLASLAAMGARSQGSSSVSQ